MFVFLRCLNRVYSLRDEAPYNCLSWKEFLCLFACLTRCKGIIQRGGKCLKILSTYLTSIQMEIEGAKKTATQRKVWYISVGNRVNEKNSETKMNIKIWLKYFVVADQNTMTTLSFRLPYLQSLYNIDFTWVLCKNVKPVQRIQNLWIHFHRNWLKKMEAWKTLFL